MDESIFGDLDEMSLPELPDSVWMRLLANALDPDTPAVGLDLIPTDLTPDDTVTDDDITLFGEDLGDDGSTADDGDTGTDDHHDGADGLHGLTDHDSDHDADHGAGSENSAAAHHDIFGHGDPGSDNPFGAQPWSDQPDDPYTGDHF